MERTAYPYVGSYSTGTLRVQDLLRAAIDALDDAKEWRSFDGPEWKDRYSRADDLAGAIERRMERGGDAYFNSEAAYWDLEALEDAIQEFLPEGYYYGAHEGDGADVGVWPVEDD